MAYAASVQWVMKGSLSQPYVQDDEVASIFVLLYLFYYSTNNYCIVEKGHIHHIPGVRGENLALSCKHSGEQMTGPDATLLWYVFV